MNNLPENHFLKDVKKSKNIFIQFLIFIGAFLVATSITSIFSSIGLGIYVASSGIEFDPTNTQSLMDVLRATPMLILQLFLTVIQTAVFIILGVCIQKRSLRSFGFTKDKIAKKYLIGLLVGAVLISGAVGVCVATGTLKYDGVILDGKIGMLILLFFGFVLQGMSEEVIVRGYLMPNLAKKMSPTLAVILSSVVFSLMHIANDGISVLSLLNIVLIGIFFGFYIIKTNNIWGACAIHSIWNFMQGNIFGIEVSGMKFDCSIFKFTATKTGELINGGVFGVEAGLSVTIIIVIAIVAICLYKKKEA